MVQLFGVKWSGVGSSMTSQVMARNDPGCMHDRILLNLKKSSQESGCRRLRRYSACLEFQIATHSGKAGGRLAALESVNTSSGATDPPEFLRNLARTTPSATQSRPRR